MVMMVITDAIGFAGYGEGGRLILRRFCRSAVAVWLVIYGSPAIVIGTHLAVALMVVHFRYRTIDRQRIVVSSYTIAMSVRVGEQTALQHFIR